MGLAKVLKIWEEIYRWHKGTNELERWTKRTSLMVNVGSMEDMQFVGITERGRFIVRTIHGDVDTGKRMYAGIVFHTPEGAYVWEHRPTDQKLFKVGEDGKVTPATDVELVNLEDVVGEYQIVQLAKNDLSKALELTFGWEKKKLGDITPLAFYELSDAQNGVLFAGGASGAILATDGLDLYLGRTPDAKKYGRALFMFGEKDKKYVKIHIRPAERLVVSKEGQYLMVLHTGGKWLWAIPTIHLKEFVSAPNEFEPNDYFYLGEGEPPHQALHAFAFRDWDETKTKKEWKIRVFKGFDPKPLFEFKAHRDIWPEVVMSSDGKYVVVLDTRGGEQLTAYDLEAGVLTDKKVKIRVTPAVPIYSKRAEITKDGRLIRVNYTHDQFGTLDLKTGNFLRNRFAFSSSNGNVQIRVAIKYGRQPEITSTEISFGGLPKPYEFLSFC